MAKIMVNSAMGKPSDEITDAIIRVLGEAELGECLAGIARKAGTTPTTAAKHLERLKKSGRVAEYAMPPSRIYVLKER